MGINNLALLFTQQDFLISAGAEVFLAGLERIGALMIHLAFSFIVYYGIMKSKKRYLLLAILLHTLVNFGIVLLQLGVSTLALEVILLAVSLILLFCARFLTGRALSS